MNRYQPGGDIYEEIKATHGQAGADRVRAAYESGRSGAVAEVLGELRHGPRLNDSAGSIFWQQITTDPLAAPLASANRGLGNVLGSAVKGLFANPWVLLVVIVAGAVYFWPLLRTVFNSISKRS